MALIITMCGGCSLFDAFRPATVVKHPDSPMLIQRAKGNYILVSIYDPVENGLIEYGWVKIADNNLAGWTIEKFDWQAFFDKVEKLRREP